MKKLSVNKLVLTEEEINFLAGVQKMMSRISAEDEFSFTVSQNADEAFMAIENILNDAICENELNFISLEDFLTDEMALDFDIVDDGEEIEIIEEEEEENPYFKSEYELNP